MAFIKIICLSTFVSCTGAPVQINPGTTTEGFSDLSDSAEVFSLRGDTVRAIRYHKRALKIALDNSHRKHQAYALWKIAELLPKREADTSLYYLHSALEIAQSLRHYRLQTNIYKSIAEIHKQQEDYGSAIYALEAQNLLTDSLLKERQVKELKQLKIQRDATEERYLGIAIVSSLIVIMIFLGFTFIRTRRSNLVLSQSIAVRNKLFSIISHDLRGPAASLKQAHELIDNESVPIEELPLFIKMLKKQSFILNETLDSLLIWSRAQLDDIRSEPEQFDVTENLIRTIGLLNGQAMNKELTFNIALPESTNAYLDRNQFELITRNLISNAIKFSYTHGAIDIRLTQRKLWLELFITDHGVGISAARQKQFFNSGLQTTFGTNGEKGTGLGLRMVIDFVRKIGGKINLSSKPGETCFHLTLPRRQK